MEDYFPEKKNIKPIAPVTDYICLDKSFEIITWNQVNLPTSQNKEVNLWTTKQITILRKYQRIIQHHLTA